jgi:hypothetical protein
MGCQPRVVATEDDQPVVTLAALSAVALAELKLSCEGDEKPLSWFEEMIAKGILRRGRLARLMTSLAGLPLSYLPDSWPLRIDAKRNDMTADELVLAESAVSLNSKAESLTLAMRCAAETPAPGISVEAPAVDLAVRHGCLVASYAVPMDENHWQLTLEKKCKNPSSFNRGFLVK